MKKKPSKCDLELLFDDLDDVCSSAESEDPGFMDDASDVDDLIGMPDLDGADDSDDAGDEKSVDSPGAWPETDNPPLLDIFMAMVRLISTAALMKLTENWGLLGMLAVVGVGSGYTGSGLDFYAISLMAEVLA